MSIGRLTSEFQRPAVAVVVPCFNEQESAAALFQSLSRVAAALDDEYDLSFILVDDGSTDETWPALVRGAAERDRYVLLRHDRNQGIAAAIMTGIRHASADVVCSIDSDCSYDPLQLKDMLPLLADGVDLVTASPYHPAGCVRNVPGWRLFISRSASRLYSLVMRQKLHTYTSCFRVYRRQAVADVKLRYEGFVGVTELLWHVDVRGGRIVECPAMLDIRKYGQSKIRVFRVACGHLRLLVRAAWRRLLG